MLTQELALVSTTGMFAGPQRVVIGVVDAEGRELVAKAARGRHLTREHDLHCWAASTGLAVPEPVRFIDGSPQVMVTERIRGPALADVGDVAAWRDAGRLLRRLHELPPPPFALPSGPVDWLADISSEVDRARRRRLLSPMISDELLRVATAAAPLVTGSSHPRVLHGDCMPSHVLFDRSGAPHLIDLEWMRLEDPAWDLAVLSTFHPERLGAILDGYAPDASERRRLELVVPARQIERLIRAVNWHARRGHVTDGLHEPLARLVTAG